MSSADTGEVTFCAAAAALASFATSAFTSAIAVVALVTSLGSADANSASFAGSALASAFRVAGGSWANRARSPNAAVTDSTSARVMPTRKDRSAGVSFARASSVGFDAWVRGASAGHSLAIALSSGAGRLTRSSRPPMASSATWMSAASSPTTNDRS